MPLDVFDLDDSIVDQDADDDREGEQRSGCRAKSRARPSRRTSAVIESGSAVAAMSVARRVASEEPDHEDREKRAFVEHVHRALYCSAAGAYRSRIDGDELERDEGWVAARPSSVSWTCSAIRVSSSPWPCKPESPPRDDRRGRSRICVQVQAMPSRTVRPGRSAPGARPPARSGARRVRRRAGWWQWYGPTALPAELHDTTARGLLLDPRAGRARPPAPRLPRDLGEAHGVSTSIRTSRWTPPTRAKGRRPARRAPPWRCCRRRTRRALLIHPRRGDGHTDEHDVGAAAHRGDHMGSRRSCRQVGANSASTASLVLDERVGQMIFMNRNSTGIAALPSVIEVVADAIDPGDARQRHPLDAPRDARFQAAPARRREAQGGHRPSACRRPANSAREAGRTPRCPPG